MSKLKNGIIHGRTVELSEDPGMDEGQQVQVILRPAEKKGTWGEGLRRCAGALADSWSDEDDRILDQLHQERQQDSRQEIEA